MPKRMCANPDPSAVKIANKMLAQPNYGQHFEEAVELMEEGIGNFRRMAKSAGVAGNVTGAWTSEDIASIWWEADQLERAQRR